MKLYLPLPFVQRSPRVIEATCEPLPARVPSRNDRPAMDRMIAKALIAAAEMERPR
jgi:hypothetical protein